ncbi:MAG: murein biosynthesis integral membrane protein MurJ [Propionibacteriaceae bacterium]|nr:murein biosynthesis integral membrane protein MurJ [Propionibacteriaceae bacterium]
MSEQMMNEPDSQLTQPIDPPIYQDPDIPHEERSETTINEKLTIEDVLPPEPEPYVPKHAVMDRPKLMSSTMLMASGTLVSRILGMVRVTLVAYLLIAGSESLKANMFNIAMGLPAQAYLLLAGGILNAILVPQLMRAIHEDEDGGQAYSDRIVTLFGLMVGGLTVILVVMTPLLTRLLTRPALRAPEMAEQYHSLMILVALCLPQVFFFGMFFLGGQILNSRGSFGPLMWAPVVNNVIQIIMLGTYAVMWGFGTDPSGAFTTAQVLLLGIGSVFGVACQAAILIPFLKKAGFTYRPRFDFLRTGLGSTAQMAKWALALVAVDQILYVISTRLASNASAGVYVFDTAMLISLVPHSLLTVSLSTALLPSLSHLAVSKQWAQFCEQLASGLRIIYAAIIPFSLLLAALGLPVAILVFSREGSGVYIGWTLIILAIGLIPNTLRFLAFKGFNSMQNTRTPFFAEIAFVVLTGTVALVLVAAWKIPSHWVAPSIAAGYLIGYVGCAVMAWILLCRDVPGLAETNIITHMVRLIAISTPGALLAGAISFLQLRFFPGWWFTFVGLVVAVIAAIGVYWGLAKMTKVEEITQLAHMIRSKLGKEMTVESSEEVRQEPDSDVTEPANDGVEPETDVFEPATDASEPANDTIEPAHDVIQPANDVIEELSIKDLGPFIPERSEETQPILTGLAPLVPGALIAQRYRLGTLLGHAGVATRWSGVDEGLSRPVFITAFPNDDNAADILEAARRASGAMDARFLRILDAGQDPDQAYVISEWVDSATLAEVLSSTGPLTSLESAWVIREIAAALASVHAMRFYHCRLDPTQVYLSAAGGVKISGLCVDRILSPRPQDAQLAGKDMEAMDVVGCGGLLYACLTATWPGKADVGLESSPRNDQGLRPPLQVRPETLPALDQITHQILSLSNPDHIASTQAIEAALSAIVGSEDPSAALADRVAAAKVPQVPIQAQRPRILPAQNKEEIADISYEDTELLSDEEPDDDEPIMEPTMAMEDPRQFLNSPPRAPIPVKSAQLWSRVFLVLVAMVAVALVSALIVGLYNSSATPKEPKAPKTPEHTVITRTIVGADIFDPREDGGSGWENDELVPLAYDGDPATIWPTEEYDGLIIPNTKPGVGLVFDLGEAVEISQTTLTMTLMDVRVVVFVPAGDPSVVTTADRSTIDNWTPLKFADITDPETTIDFDPVTTRFVLIYFTKLLNIGNGQYQANIAEATFAG